MAHVRQQLVEAIAGVLTGLATTGGRVFTDRAREYELQDAELPALRVYDDGDEAEAYTLSAPGAAFTTYRRQTRFVVEAVAKASSGVSAEVRQICAEVETVLGAALTVGGVQVQCYYRGSDVEVSVEGDRPVSVARLRFEVELFTHSSAPETLA